jgi:hypothetical protein
MIPHILRPQLTHSTQTTEYCAGKQPHGWQSGKVVLLGGYDGQSTKARTMLRPESAQESKDSVVQSSFISAFPAHHTRASTAPGGQPRVVKQIPTQAGAMRKLEFGAPAPAMPTAQRHPPNEGPSGHADALHQQHKEELRPQDAAYSSLRAERSRPRQGAPPLGDDVSQQIRLWTSFLQAQAQGNAQAHSGSCDEDAEADHANVDVYAPGFPVPFQNTVRDA